MFRVLDMIDFCILFKTSLHLKPSSWLNYACIELNHPFKKSITMLYCFIQYFLTCWWSSKRKGPYFNIFSSSFFSRFCIQGQLIFKVVIIFTRLSTIVASTLQFADTLLYSANTAHHILILVECKINLTKMRTLRSTFSRRVVLVEIRNTKEPNCQSALYFVTAEKPTPSQVELCLSWHLFWATVEHPGRRSGPGYSKGSYLLTQS